MRTSLTWHGLYRSDARV